MSIIIHWKLPDCLPGASTAAYSVNIYKSTQTEDSDYQKIATIDAKSGANWLSSYTDAGGNASAHYYVKYYIPPSGDESDRYLAWVEFTVREQRMIETVYNQLPDVVKANVDIGKRYIYDAVYGSLYAINMIAPQTSYSISNMPKEMEIVVKIGSLLFLYLEQYLAIAIKDFSYGDNGLSLAVDRGAKINVALQSAISQYNELAKIVKFHAYPDAMGLGSYAIAVPQGRILSFLYNIREAS